MAGGRKRQVSGAKFSDRACSQICRVMADFEEMPMTVVEIRSAMMARGWRQIPTPNQMGNLLGKAPYFQSAGEVSQQTTIVGRAKVHLWVMNRDEATKRGWLNNPFENRPIDDPYIEGETTNRYRGNGVLIGGPKDHLSKNYKSPKL